MENNNNIRFSSIKDFFTSKKNTLSYKMVVPFDDNYRIKIKSKILISVYDENDVELIKTDKTFDLPLKKDEHITVNVERLSGNVASFEVMALHHRAVSPYEPYGVLNITNKDARKDKDLSLELTTCTKRDDGEGLYINCNNPEKLHQEDLNKALSRVDISNKKVFFTFEHNDYEGKFYYGYQVKNTDNKDIYITVLNIGYQISGSGTWLGEDEWTQFYNVNFKGDLSGLDDKQLDEFKRMYNFSLKCKAHKYQPITYRIPKGKYIYVMGGTTKDAYKHLNVFNSANKIVPPSCSNGVVLFKVHGKAEGAFFAYDDINKIKNNNTHQGYVKERDGKLYGRQYVGYDNCHGVVDTHLVFKFDDSTKPQDLKIKFINYYDEKNYENGSPNQKLNATAHETITSRFVTHINSENEHNAFGTDMTIYKTVDDKGNDLVIEPHRLDPNGLYPNIGNWMVDYMDYYYLVNKGDNERTIHINMTNTGSLCVMVKDINGKVIKGTPMFTFVTHSDRGSEYNIIKEFNYEVKVKPHTVKKFIIEYNLLANSCGNVPHKVTLKK